MRALSLIVCASLTAGAAASESRTTARLTPSGVIVETVTRPSAAQTSNPFAVQEGNLLWTYAGVPAAIAESITVSDLDATWIGWNLNNERVSFMQTTGAGTPLDEFLLSAGNPDSVAVSVSESASRCAVLIQRPASGGMLVEMLTSASSSTPIWTYNFPAAYTFGSKLNLDVSHDGGVVIAAASQSLGGGAFDTLVVVLDGATGAVINSTNLPSTLNGLELSDDASRAMVTQGATAVIVNLPALTTAFSFAVSGTGGSARISGDGTTAVAGGFNYRIFREVAGVWTQLISTTEANQWFGAGVALSADGSYGIVASYTYLNYLELTYRVFQISDGGATELARSTTLGTGGFQDTIVRAQASADGQYFAVASWGTQNNAHPEVQIFDRDAVLVGSIDTPGSPFSLDMSTDGRYVVAGTKAVHANTFGNGGEAYAYEVFSLPACGGDIDGDGNTDQDDLNLLLATFGLSAGDPGFNAAADLVADGVIDQLDLNIVLANFGCV